MAGELWNRVNILFPSAVSSVRVHFSSATGTVDWSERIKINMPAESGVKLWGKAPYTGCLQPTWEDMRPPSAVLMYFIITAEYIVMSERCFFSADANVKALLVENEKVLKLIQSELLQTEVRVLYDLLYVLNNSFRSNKTLKGLKQVRARGGNTGTIQKYFSFLISCHFTTFQKQIFNCPLDSF